MCIPFFSRAVWHASCKCFTSILDLFIPVPNPDQCCNVLCFWCYCVSLQFPFNYTPQIFYWVLIRGISWPWKCIDFVHGEISYGLGLMATCSIMHKHEVAIRKPLLNLWEKPCFQYFFVLLLLHISFYYVQSTCSMYRNTTSYHYWRWMFDSLWNALLGKCLIRCSSNVLAVRFTDWEYWFIWETYLKVENCRYNSLKLEERRVQAIKF